MASARQNQPDMKKVLRPVYDPGSSVRRPEVAHSIHPLPANFFRGLSVASSRKTTGWRLRLISFILTATCLLAGAVAALCSDAAMKGPGTMTPRHTPGGHGPETSAVKLVFLGAVDLYRNRISPIQGQRCGFYPTCSAFGRQAVSEYGVLQGVIMTADRLTRCNIFKEPGPDYFLLPGGRLFDPVSANSPIDKK